MTFMKIESVAYDLALTFTLFDIFSISHFPHLQSSTHWSFISPPFQFWSLCKLRYITFQMVLFISESASEINHSPSKFHGAWIP